MKSKKNTKDVKKGKKVKHIVLVAIVLVAIILIVVPIIINKKNSKDLEVVVKSSFEKMQNINELSSVELIYKAIAKKNKDNDPNDPEYYVKYDGVVKAGIDFNKLDIKVDEIKKVVTVTVPEIIYTDLTVNAGTLEYIFFVKQDDDKNISQEAIKLCKDDLKNRVEKEEKLKEVAKENIVLFIQGLMKGYMASFGDEYKLEVK